MEINLTKQAILGLKQISLQYENVQITSKDELDNVIKLIKDIQLRKATIKAEHEKVTKPLLEAIAAERARFKPIIDFCDNFIIKLKQKVLIHIQAQQKIKQEAIKTLEQKEQEAIQNDDIETKVAIQQAKVDIADNKILKGASPRKIWTYKVIDFDKVPKEYLTVNDKALNKLASVYKDEKKIDGIEFYYTETMVMGR